MIPCGQPDRDSQTRTLLPRVVRELKLTAGAGYLYGRFCRSYGCSASTGRLRMSGRRTQPADARRSLRTAW